MTGIYVSANGNDETGDGSQEKPFRTIRRADQENERIAKANECIPMVRASIPPEREPAA